MILIYQWSLHTGSLRGECGQVASSQETSMVVPVEETSECYDNRTSGGHLHGCPNGRNLHGRPNEKNLHGRTKERNL